MHRLLLPVAAVALGAALVAGPSAEAGGRRLFRFEAGTFQSVVSGAGPRKSTNYVLDYKITNATDAAAKPRIRLEIKTDTGKSHGDAQDATAFAARDVSHNIIIDGVWLPHESGERAAAETAWVRGFLDALRPHRAEGVYVNFLDADDDRSRVLAAYGERNYRRLAEVKAKYDPDYAFHHNKNIRPGPTASR